MSWGIHSERNRALIPIGTVMLAGGLGLQVVSGLSGELIDLRLMAGLAAMTAFGVLIVILQTAHARRNRREN